MNVYIKHRFLLLLPVLLGITFFTFVLMQLPGRRYGRYDV